MFNIYVFKIIFFFFLLNNFSFIVELYFQTIS